MDERDIRENSDRCEAELEELGVDNTRARKKERERSKRKKRVVFFILVLLAWAGLVYGGYSYAARHLQETEQHLANRVEELKLQNERTEEAIIEAMQLFQEELEITTAEIMQVRSEMNAIQEELELTGESITGTDETRQSLQERITDLDRQLAALRDQLQKLEEAARAF